MGNFDTDYISSAFLGEGYTDVWNIDSRVLFTEPAKSILTKRRDASSADAAKYTFEFCIIPNNGFLGNFDCLLKDVELKLCFDRTSAEQVLMCADGKWDPIDPKPTLEIKECFAITEWISSPNLRSYFDTIDYTPIRYEYEDCEVFVKSVQQSETNIRFDNLRGGNVPTHMFIGFIETAALNGSHLKSSTRFSNHDVEYINITLNGNGVNGYPMRITNGCPVQPLQKFLNCTNRTCDISSGKMFTADEFKYNWLWSHCLSLIHI